MRSNCFRWLQIVAILTAVGILLPLAGAIQATPARGEHLVQPSSAPRVQVTWQTRRPESATAVSVPAPANAASLYLPLVVSDQPVSGPPEEWSQHAHDAQRTGYTPQTVPYSLALALVLERSQRQPAASPRLPPAARCRATFSRSPEEAACTSPLAWTVSSL
jgi:hypothetical protein